MGVSRISHEKLALARLQEELSQLPDVYTYSGQGAGNRFGIPSWALPLTRQFQFGDLRIESPNATIIVEAESAGGVNNLAKYWPYLLAYESGKRFVLIHLFLVGSEGDYLSHRMLWEFLVERMREDLKVRRGLCWPDHWEAAMFTYRSGDDLGHIGDYITLQRQVTDEQGARRKKELGQTHG